MSNKIDQIIEAVKIAVSAYILLEVFTYATEVEDWQSHVLKATLVYIDIFCHNTHTQRRMLAEYDPIETGYVR